MRQEMSVSSMQSPVINGGIMNMNQQITSIDEDNEDPIQQEPTAFGHPPQMMQQSESFPYNSDETLPQPYYYNLKRVQEGVTNTI